MFKKSARKNFYDRFNGHSRVLDKPKNQSKFTRFLKFYLFIIVGLFLLRTLISLPSLVGSLSKPFPNLIGSFVKEGQVDFSRRTNLLLASLKNNQLRALAVASVSKTDKGIAVMFFDPAAKVYTDSGEESLEGLIVTKNGLNFDKLIAKLTQTLGINLDGYLITTNGKDWVNKESIKDVTDNLFSLKFFMGFWGTKSYLNQTLKTNLSLGQLVTLTSLAKGVKAQNFDYFDFKNAQDASGFLNTDTVEARIGISLQDQAIAAEDLTVEIVNANSVEGLENTLKKIITNLGVTVLQTDNAPKTAKSVIFTNKKTSKFVGRLKEILNADVKSLGKENSGLDARVVIGDDYAKFFNF